MTRSRFLESVGGVIGDGAERDIREAEIKSREQQAFRKIDDRIGAAGVSLFEPVAERPIAAADFENAGGGGEPVESTAVVQKINPLLIGPSIVIDDDAIDIVADLAKPPRRDEHMMARQRQPLIDIRKIAFEVQADPRIGVTREVIRP